MSTRKSREIEAALEAKGFQRKNSDHKRFHLYVDGRKTSVYTFLSHGKSEYDAVLLGFVAKQLKLPRKQLDRLLDCPMSYEEYLEHLTDTGILRVQPASDESAADASGTPTRPSRRDQ